MRYTKEITSLVVLAALAALGSAQTKSGDVQASAGASGGSYPAMKWATLKPGDTSLFVSNSDAGPGATANTTASAQAGYVRASYEGVSYGQPYGSGSAMARFSDSVRWTGTTPIRVKLRIQNVASAIIGGSDPMQTSAGNYANVAFMGTGVNSNQTRQEGGGRVSGGFSDVIVILQPGKWYTLSMQAKAYGDTADQTKPYGTTTSLAGCSLTAWFELVDVAPGSLQSFSGHSYGAPTSPNAP